jgi:hypothetical protein
MMSISGPAIIDSGTAIIVTNDEQASEFHMAIPSAENNGYTTGFSLAIPSKSCEEIFALLIGKVYFNIPTRDVVREPVNGLDGWCYSAITSGASNFIVLGEEFLRHNYVVFDRRNTRIDIAPNRK